MADSVEPEQDWRSQTLRRAMLFGIPLAILFAIPLAAREIAVGSSPIFTAELIGLSGLWVYGAWASGLRRGVRFALLLTPLMVVATHAQLTLGAPAGAAVTLASCVVLSGVFASTRVMFGIAAWGCTTYLLQPVFATVVPEIDVRMIDARTPVVALRFAIAFGLMTVLVSLTITTVLQALERGLAQTKDALARLQHESECRSRADEARRAAERAFHSAQRHEALARLSASVAHDFNNQLMVVQTWASLMAQTQDRALHREGLRAIIEATARSAQLSRQLQQVGHPEPPAVEGSCNLAAFLGGRVSTIERMLPADIRLEFVADATGEVPAAEVVLDQILLNLVINARDAMPRGGRLLLETRTRASEGGACAQLIVGDSGVGMQASTLARAFEPFFTTKGKLGTGLGLASVRGLVEAIGGEVAVRSSPGDGTTFTIDLPILSSQVALEQKPARVADGRTTVTVLLVDGNGPTRGALVRVLRAAGHEVVEATSAHDAIDLLRLADRAIDVLCTETVLLGGHCDRLLEAFERVFPHGEVIICSAHLEDEQIQRGVDAGRYACLPRPFSGDQLLTTIEDLTGRRSDPES